MNRPPDPQTPEEWQIAVNMAEFVLTVDSLEQYGLIKTDLLYNRDRAYGLLQAGATRGYFPRTDGTLSLPPRRKRGRPRKVR